MFIKMKLFKCYVIAIVGFFGYVHGEGLTLSPCKMDDLQCLRWTTKSFLENTAQGIPNYDLRPIDPMIIPALTFDIGFDTGLVWTWKNLNVEGLKNLNISSFAINTANRSVELTMDIHVQTRGLVTMEYKNLSLSYCGNFSSNASGIAKSAYTYEIEDGADSKSYFHMSEETNTYQVEEEPQIKIYECNGNHEWADDEHTEDTGRIALLHSKEIRKLYTENLLAAIVPTVIHNLRQAAKVLPKAMFFKD